MFLQKTEERSFFFFFLERASGFIPLGAPGGEDEDEDEEAVGAPD